jgi:hypothetical protein
METKVCTVCGEEKLIMDFFYKGKDSKCKVCRLAYNRSRYAETVAPHTKKYTYDRITEKKCKHCGEVKPISEFAKHHTGVFSESGYRDNCKVCTHLLRDRVGESERHREYRLRTFEQRRERKRQYLSVPENREKNRLYAVEYNKKNPNRQRRRILSQYGIDEETYDNLLQKQCGVCAICGCKSNGRKKHFVVDHDHKTGKVRALLCTQCNAGLGNYYDKENLLRKAAEYLDSFNH